METAYDDAKYGHFSRKPYIDMIIPTLVDPSMAPPGKHVISCFVQYAPYKLAPELGTWDDQRDAFGDAVIDRIAEFAPNIRDIILHRNVQTPLDIERTTGLTEGNIFQGELSLEQLFFNRPVPGYARFRTPVRDLWLCGSSTHPGGGIMGANGRIAALEVLRGARPEGGLSDGERGVTARRTSTTRSSSVAATTGSSRRPTWARPACGRSSSNDARRSVGRSARPSSRPGRGCRRWPTRSGGCGRRSSATSTSSDTACRSSGPTSGRSRPAPTARPISLWGDAARTAEGLRARSAADAERYADFDRLVRSLAGFLGDIAGETPPDIESPGLGDALAGLRLGRTFRGLGKHDGRTITRVLPMAIADFVAESFETDALRAAIAWRGVQYTAMGPWSAGTTAVLLIDAAGNDGGAAGQTVFVRGGPGALADALAAAATDGRCRDPDRCRGGAHHLARWSRDRRGPGRRRGADRPGRRGRHRPEADPDQARRPRRGRAEPALAGRQHPDARHGRQGQPRAVGPAAVHGRRR